MLCLHKTRLIRTQSFARGYVEANAFVHAYIVRVLTACFLLMHPSSYHKEARSGRRILIKPAYVFCGHRFWVNAQRRIKP
jgi:hypothetical protein